jgi:hypothetical protein
VFENQLIVGARSDQENLSKLFIPALAPLTD